MIFERFQKTVAEHPHRLAIKSGERHVTFRRLERMAGAVADGISLKEAAVGLLFGRGEWMIAAMLGVLKTGNIYVPLDASYPQKRLAYMVDHSQARLLLTDNANLPLAEALTERLEEWNCRILNVETMDSQGLVESPVPNPSPDRPAYILYTSGSTGKPKGVAQTNGNVCRVIDEWIRCFGINGEDRLTLLPAYSHDSSVMDIYCGLLSGTPLFPLDVRELDAIDELPNWLERERITVWHSVPTLFRYFLGTLTEERQVPRLRLALLGGEAVTRRDVELFRQWLPNAGLKVIYGQSESSLNSIWSHEPGQQVSKPTLGKTITDVELLLVDDDGDEVEELGVGEIFVCSPNVAAGYWRDQEATDRSFFQEPELGRLYRTGDLGRLRPDGSIEFLGRKDFQVKIRGFRVELGEIEAALLSHEGVKEATVIARQLENGEVRLSAFVTAVAGWSNSHHRLALELPDYMVPSSITAVETMPLTPSGKIDRRGLQTLAELEEKTERRAPPADPLQQRLAGIWSRVLDIPENTIGVDVSFLQMGGHSLNAGQLAAAIHRELEVKIPLSQIFETPTIQELAAVIRRKDKQRFAPVEPSEKQDYYPLSPAQKRLLVMQQLDPASTHYNMPQFLPLDHTPDLERLNRTFRQLIRRHESLRTSFCHVDDQPVQRVCDDVSFEVSVYPLRLSNDRSRLNAMMEEFVQPFDLSRPPLLRVEVVKMDGGGSMIMVDMHHVIADGNSLGVLQREFSTLYNGGELEPLSLQYRDYSLWQEGRRREDGVWRQERFWLEQFADDHVPLVLPVIQEAGDQGDFAGHMLRFSVEEPMLRRLRQLATNAGVTMSMLLFSVYSALLSRVSGQEELVVGIPVAGRGHADLQSIIGMFVNLLPIRCYPAVSKTFGDFLEEVRTVSIAAYENQEFQFEELIQRLGLSGRDADNSLVQTVFVYAFEDISAGDITPGHSDGANRVAKFPLTLGASEMRDRLFLDFEYRACLFRRHTIARLKQHLLAIVEAVTTDPSVTIAAIELEPREDTAHEVPALEAEFGF